MKKKKFLAPAALVLILVGVGVILSSLVPSDQQGSAKVSESKEIRGETFLPNFNTQQFDQEVLGEGKEGQKKDEFLVTKVIDGDTIEIEGGVRVRYIGIDTPETVDPRKPVQCFGKEASAENRRLVEGKKVQLEKDVLDTDKYGRLLRYIWLEDTLVNEVLVEKGFAYSSPYPPDIKYQERLDTAERRAQKENIGFWGKCDPDGLAKSQSQYQSGECYVKGNISGSGEKIYHLPGQRYYSKTVITEEKGERWFCSEKEAQDAGWRKSKV